MRRAPSSRRQGTRCVAKRLPAVDAQCSSLCSMPQFWDLHHAAQTCMSKPAAEQREQGRQECRPAMAATSVLVLSKPKMTRTNEAVTDYVAAEHLMRHPIITGLVRAHRRDTT